MEINKLNQFLGKAALATYAGDGLEVKSQRKGFKELEYQDGDWYYRDSYAGFFQSWGQEVVWYKNEPVWTQIYGGGMQKEYQDNSDFASMTFSFLKKALSTGDKKNVFLPRGPENFSDGEWKYSCNWEGDITEFKGSEKIIYQGKVVFTHSFFGGLIIGK